jgi:uncharacterized cupredoxin-like copper-binding protein
MHAFRTTTRRNLMMIAVLATAALSFAACGSSDSGTASSTTTAPTAAVEASPLPDGTIAVTLSDISANSMLLTPSAKSAAAGKITFVVTNAGNKEHEFVVLKTETPTAELSIDDATDRTDEEAPGVENVGEIASILAGETKTIEIDLGSGHYALICNLRGHLRQGMWSDFDVT